MRHQHVRDFQRHELEGWPPIARGINSVACRTGAQDTAQTACQYYNQKQSCSKPRQTCKTDLVWLAPETTVCFTSAYVHMMMPMLTAAH